MGPDLVQGLRIGFPCAGGQSPVAGLTLQYLDLSLGSKALEPGHDSAGAVGEPGCRSVQIDLPGPGPQRVLDQTGQSLQKRGNLVLAGVMDKEENLLRLDLGQGQLQLARAWGGGPDGQSGAVDQFPPGASFCAGGNLSFGPYLDLAIRQESS